MPAETNIAAPAGILTFLVTDIEGSTPLWDAGPDAMGVGWLSVPKAVSHG